MEPKRARPFECPRGEAQLVDRVPEAWEGGQSFGKYTLRRSGRWGVYKVPRRYSTEGLGEGANPGGGGRGRRSHPPFGRSAAGLPSDTELLGLGVLALKMRNTVEAGGAGREAGVGGTAEGIVRGVLQELRERHRRPRRGGGAASLGKGEVTRWVPPPQGGGRQQGGTWRVILVIAHKKIKKTRKN